MNKLLTYFFYAIIFLVWLGGCSGGCSTKSNEKKMYEVKNKPLVMIVKQRSDAASTRIAHELATALNYTKIPFLQRDLELPAGKFGIPETVRMLVITTSDTEKFTRRQFDRILEFVGRGHTVFFTGPVFDDRLNFLTGIKNGAAYKLNTKAEGYRFNQTVFPGYSQGKFKLRNPYYHNGLQKEIFQKKVSFIAQSFDSTQAPVITKHSIGGGQVLMFNSVTAYDKLLRGLLFSVVLSSLKHIPYPVANVSTVFLDDFPLPLYDQKRPPIEQEFDVTEETFVTNIWWPDMQALADTFDIDYTALLAFNYNANVVPPFDFEEWEGSSININGERVNGSEWLAKQVKQSRHELGFHGYNHFSLLSEEWPQQEFMVAAVKAARKRWNIDNLGPLPVTYVPPTNNIDSTGIEALTKGMPQLKILSSLYLENVEDGGGREFGSDPYDSELYNYPRISSGFLIGASDHFDIQSLYLISGIWTHFVHPDDVFQVNQREEDNFASRNPLGLGWRNSEKYDFSLYSVFKDYLQKIEQTYPFIRYRTARDAVPVVKEWRDLRLKRRATDSLRYIVKQNNRGQLSTWFMYVPPGQRDNLVPYLREQSETYHFTPYWQGHLVQFISRRDSIAFPIPRQEFDSSESNIRELYLAYQKSEDANAGDGEDSPWQDTRLPEAREALAKNPSSQPLQQRVIKLAVELDRVPLAIEILEQRLLRSPTWHSADINDLLTYYGWVNGSERAYQFLERLWNIYGDESIIKLKDMMVQRYGSPGEVFEKRWLERELKLNPNDEQLLQKLVLQNQSSESWEETRTYIDQLIAQNPQSDSLYFYKLQRSFYYDPPALTLATLEKFPEHAGAQLQPLAAEIANLYAYEARNYTKALEWAARAQQYPVRPPLEWLLQQKRYHAFMRAGDKALQKMPANDSLRTFIGQQLIYEGFYNEGYQRLYPLFEGSVVPESARELVHAEIGYQSYEQRKAFFKKYPAFFSDSLRNNLRSQYRKLEGAKVALTADIASDNFNNSIVRFGGYAEWGNRLKYTHQIAIEDILIGSRIEQVDSNAQLLHAYYKYQRLWSDQGLNLSASAGLYAGSGRVRPDFGLAIGWGHDSTYTSGKISFSPVLTNPAIDQRITQIELSAYREDYWLRNRLQSALSITARRYSNSVYSYEMLSRLYWKWPFDRADHRLRTIGELSYADATESYSGGVPYYTPERLFTKGAGLEYRYRGILDQPKFSFELELMGKHANRDGFYLSTTARINAQIKKYWDVSLNADISSSDVYRYNHVGITVSYLFPKKISSMQ